MEITHKLGTLERYSADFDRAVLNQDTFSKNQLAYTLKKLAFGEEKYRSVEAKTEVPWFLVGCLHGLEASFNFNTCLHNGDPLPGPTKNVPKGRGPFDSWEDAAVDALLYEIHSRKLDIGEWTIERCLWFAELYNGVGYLKRGRMSPYLWSGTSLYTRGKYVRDGIYNPFATSKQVGVASVIKALLNRGAIQIITQDISEEPSP